MMDVEKIQSVLFRFSDKFVLKHIVKLAYKDKIGNRRGYHSVVKYNTDNYIKSSVGDLCNISIHFKSYLLLECIDLEIPWSIRQNLMITEDNIHKFINKLKKARKWFKAKKYDDLFYLEDGILKLNKEMSKELVEYVQFNNDKSIVLTPAVITDKGQNYEGILMFVNNKETIITLSINELKTLLYILKKMNLYQSGLSCVNYIGRPKQEDVFDITKSINYKEKSNFDNKINNYNREEYSNDSFKESTKGYFK